MFGTFVGALADKHGRKRFSVLYGLLYACSCLCKMVNSWPVLVLGRLLSGVSTSLLFSVFDSWMVSEHRRHGFPDAGLANTFSIATLSNGVSAVLSGIVASAVADDWALGYGFRAPFAVAATVLVGLAFLVHFSWTENVGEAPQSQQQQQQQQSPASGIIGRVFGNALADLRTNRRVALLCGIQSLFEGAMYSFVFAWTPALRGPCGGDEANDALPPLGWVFAAYMVGIMIGSQLFTLAVTKFRMAVERVAQYTFAAASGALIVGCTAVQTRPGTCADAGTHTSVVLVAFVVFEICCGVYFPCMGTLKGLHLPERSRSALMNFARVGLNLFLLVILLSADMLSNAAIIGICATALAGACFCQTAFNRLPPVASAAASATEEMV